MCCNTELLEATNKLICAVQQSATPLYIAVREGHLEIVQRLLSHKGVHLNQPAKVTLTPQTLQLRGKHRIKAPL